MTVTAATSAAAGTNQYPPRADLAPSPCCARGLHSVRGHHTEPRKTCSRVRGFCNSAIMKRGSLRFQASSDAEIKTVPRHFARANQADRCITLLHCAQRLTP